MTYIGFGSHKSLVNKVTSYWVDGWGIGTSVSVTPSTTAKQNIYLLSSGYWWTFPSDRTRVWDSITSTHLVPKLTMPWVTTYFTGERHFQRRRITSLNYTINSKEYSPSRDTHCHSANKEIPHQTMELKGSSSCSQDPTTLDPILRQLNPVVWVYWSVGLNTSQHLWLFLPT